MKPMYVYDTIFLTKDDYDFFQSLPAKQKILFLFDLCLEVEISHEEDLDEQEETNDLLSKDLLSHLKHESADPSYVHIFFLPDTLILASNVQTAADSVKSYLYSDGYIFVKSEVKSKMYQREIFEYQKYFKNVGVFDLLSISSYPSSLN